MGKIGSFFSDVERQRFLLPKTLSEIIFQGRTEAKQKKYKNEEDVEYKSKKFQTHP